MTKKISLLMLVVVGGAIAYALTSDSILQSDTTKPWWRGTKLVVISVEGDQSDSFEVYAESDGKSVLNATVYQKMDFSSSECSKDSEGRYCLATGPDGTKFRITPHPTGRIDSE